MDFLGYGFSGKDIFHVLVLLSRRVLCVSCYGGLGLHSLRAVGFRASHCSKMV